MERKHRVTLEEVAEDAIRKYLAARDGRERKHSVALDEAAAVLSVSPRSLADRRFRCRIGLVARKVGRKTVFLMSDLERLLERGKEHLPGAGRQ